MPLRGTKSTGGAVGRLAFVFWIAAAAVGATLVATAPAMAQSVVIREIRVEGNRRVEPETVRSYLAISVGNTYDSAKVDQSLKALFATGLFRDVRIDRSGATLVVTVVENPIVNRVAFEGNSQVEKASLEGEVQLKPRSILTRAKVQADVQRVLDVYRRQGRFSATVEPKIIELPQNRVDLVFEINEGGQTKVKSINFIGNHAFSDSQLRDIISTGESGWLDFLKGNSIYDPDRVNLDRELLRQYYLKNGYADVRVVAATADVDREGKGFYITYTIEEGQLYKFGTIQIVSNVALVNAQALGGELLLNKGDVFNASLIEKTIEKLTLAAAEQGYAFARIRPKVDRDEASRIISITFVIEEGPRIYIERINIVGNTRTRDYVIRREFRLAEGDAYNPLLVDRAKKRLQALGYFKGVEVKRTAGSAQDRVALDVIVVEQSTGELSFGAGYSTSEGVIGDVSITERNLLGRGQFLRLKLSGSAERQQVDLSFTEPRFLDRNLAAGFDLFHKTVDFTSTSSYKSQKTGGSLRLGFPLSERLWMQVNYTLLADDVFDVGIDASNAVKQAAGKSLTSSLGYSLTWDARNHPKNPNRGYYFQLAQDFAGVGGDVNYIRTAAEARAYYPLTEKITFVGRLIGGQIEGWGGQDVRLIDLYYKGGETIRGFERSGIGPRDIASVNQDALGGKYFYSATAEIRYPFPFIPDELGMSGAIFFDAGSLWGVDSSTKTLAPTLVGAEHSLRASIGTSIIWNSPVGPLRLDYSYVLKKEDFDKTEVLRFGATTKF